MRSFVREARAVLSIWWLIVPGGGLGVVAIVSFIKGSHHVSAWLWVAAAMTALWLATCLRLRQIIKERDRLNSVLNEEHSRDATVVRLEGFVREYEQLGKELPDRPEGVGPVVSDEQLGWSASLEHLGERVKSELRMNAPGFLAYWNSNAEPLPFSPPLKPWGEAYVGLSLRQLRHIIDRLTGGYDSPLGPDDSGWPHSGHKRQNVPRRDPSDDQVD